MDVPSGWVRVTWGPRPPRTVQFLWAVGVQGSTRSPSPPKSSSASPQVFQRIPVLPRLLSPMPWERSIAAIGARQRSCPRSPRSIADCPEQEQVAFSSGAGGVVQEVLGAGQAEGVERRPPLRKQFTRQRLPRESADSPNYKWKRQSQLVKCFHRCQFCRGEIDALIRERGAGRAVTESERQGKWMGTGSPSVETNPPMPNNWRSV